VPSRGGTTYSDRVQCTAGTEWCGVQGSEVLQGILDFCLVPGLPESLGPEPRPGPVWTKGGAHYGKSLIGNVAGGVYLVSTVWWRECI
jgi:hypothetical protein